MKTDDRKIWLIRHAKPDFPTNERYCVGGGTDWPIGAEGRRQCEEMAAALLPVLRKEKEEGRMVELWSSPMLRARQTAAYLAENGQEIRVKAGMQEAFAGLWEGMPFSRIREEYPDIYAARSQTHGMNLIPGAERDEDSLRRFSTAMKEVLTESQADDLVLVAHSRVIQLLLCAMEGKPLSESRQFRLEYAEAVCPLMRNVEEYLGSTELL